MRLLRRIVFCCAGLMAFLVVALGAIQEAGAAGPAPTTAQFASVCPTNIGVDKHGCALIIVVDNTGATVYANPVNDGPYDGSEDTLVGILNNSSSAISSISLSSSATIFGFDGDGLCTYITVPNCEPNGYGGPGVTFTTTNTKSGAVNFATPLAAGGGSAYFSLEEALTSSDVSVTAPLNTGAPKVPGTPELNVQLSADHGTWSNSPTSYSYQWEHCDSSGLNCGSPGPGSSSPNYTPNTNDVGHTLVVVVTATNGDGYETVSSAPSAVVTGPPSNSLAPSISGTPTVGQSLIASPGTWSGYPAPTFTYEWQDCTNTCSDVQTGSNDHYLLGTADEGKTVQVIVKATNGVAPDVSLTTAQTGAVTGPPSNSLAPSISGTPTVGQSLIASPGTWSGYPAPTFTYEWQDCTNTCSDVQTGSNDHYLLGTADEGKTVQVIVKASNGVAPDASLTTAQTGAVTGAPSNSGAKPSISGTVTSGQTLTASPGVWSGYPAPTFSYVWQDCQDAGATNCATVQSGSNTQYVLSPADAGLFVRVQVTASNGIAPDATANSPTTTAVTQSPSNSGAKPSISGTVTSGQTLTASPGVWSGYPAPTFSYVWQDCQDAGATNCATVQSGSNTQYVLSPADAGLFVRVQVTASNGIAPDATANSPTTTAVTQSPSNSGAKPSISGTVTSGQTLTASPGVWSGYPAPTFSYVWQDCQDAGATNCATVQSGSNTQYVLSPADAGLFVRVQVTASNGIAPDATANSPTTTAVTQAPGNSQLPSISGTAQQGVALSGSAGNWTGYPTPTLSLQWEDCDSQGNNCAPVAANGNSLGYTPTALDVGDTLVLSVTASNTAGHLTLASAPTAPVLIAAPTNNTPPTISGAAAAQQDVQLTATNGTWANSPTSFDYQWESCDSSGNGCQSLGPSATSQTYTPGAGDVGGTLRVTVTAHNAGGKGSATSAQTATVQIGVPRNNVLPVISGKTQTGEKLSASLGTWTNSPASYAYQWSRCDFSGNNCNDIPTEFQSTYIVVNDDIGGTLRVTVTAFNAGGHSAATSDPSEPVSIAAPVNGGLPLITGTVQQGQTLSASHGVWSNSPDSFAYQWEQCDGSGGGCGTIFGAKSSSYVPGVGDVGHTLRVIVTAHNSTADAMATSAQTVAVLIAAPMNTGPPQLSGTPQQGQAPAATPGTWDNSPTTFSYQWLLCDASGGSCSPILGANAIDYSPVVTDVGHTLRLAVTAKNDGGSTTVTSGPSAVVAGLEASIPPPVLGQSANLSPVSGKVLIELPGSNTFVPLDSPIDVPDGSTIDATLGTVSLTVALPNGTFQTGQFYSGQFIVGQSKNGKVNAELSGGSFAACKAHKHKHKHGARAASSHKKPKTVVRQLWGNAHGNYTTKGRYGSASVSGTVWLTQDRCDGTYFKAQKDDVFVIAFAHPHKKHHLKQGQSIFIPAS